MKQELIEWAACCCNIWIASINLKPDIMTKEDYNKINRLIAVKIEGCTEHRANKSGSVKTYLTQETDHKGHLIRKNLPPYHTSADDLLRAIESVPDRYFILSVKYEVSCDVSADNLDHEGEDFPIKGGIMKALYSALAAYVLGMEGGEDGLE